MNILRQSSFWVVLYLVLGVIAAAIFWYLVERDARQHKEALALRLPVDGGEHGWTAVGLLWVPVIGIAWPLALLVLVILAITYFFWHSRVWPAWRKAAWVWFKGCCAAVWRWRPTVQAKTERTVRAAWAEAEKAKKKTTNKTKEKKC